MGGEPPLTGKDSKDKTRSMPTLYVDDYCYLKEAIGYLKQTETLQADFIDDEQQVILTATKDLKHRLRYILPREVWPEDDTFILSAEADDIQDEIKRCR